MAKVIKTQFPFPGPERLLQPYGESSPMGLLWTFMGHSTAYNVFTGAAEVLAGALVMFRRTTALGALLGIAVMANIVVLNFGYDVPVKIFSTQLLLTSAFLALPDARRLTNVLLLGRGAEPPPPRIPFRRAWLERARKPIAAATLVASLGLLTWERIDAYYERGDGADRPALYGVWQVESFAREGETAASDAATREDRWLRLAIGRWRATVGTADERVRRLEYEHDEEAHTLVLRDGHEELVSFDVQRLGAERLVLSGTYQGVPLRIALRRRQTDDFLLVERGFHWINEYPYNR